MGKKTLGAKKDSSKKPSRFVRFLRSPFTIIVIIIFVIVGGYYAFETIRYNSAPAEIKLIRQLPIYNYESDNLKIVRRSEDYGGYDWKHVYNEPGVHLYFSSDDDLSDSGTCTKDVANELLKERWAEGDRYALLGEQVTRGRRFRLDYQESQIKLSLEPNNAKDTECVVLLKR